MSAYNDPRYKAAKKAYKGRPCVYCGRPSDTVEHRTPVAAFTNPDDPRINSPENLAPACATCNYSKGATWGNKRRTAKKRYVNHRYTMNNRRPTSTPPAT